MKLKNIHEEIQINTSPENMWAILSQYGNVSNFHAGVMESHKEQGSKNQASLGCERVCKIVDLGLHITLKERIIDFVEGQSYKYEVYEWKNFPIQKMYFSFSIINATKSDVVLALDINYRAKPAFLTTLMVGKMHRMAHDILLGYKHHAQTGETRAPIKRLKVKYKALPGAEVQHG